MQVGVDVAHGALVLVVAGGADAANDVVGFNALRVVDQELVLEYLDPQLGKAARHRTQHVQTLVHAEGAMFFRIDADGHYHLVKQFHGLAYHPQVPVGHRVKTTGIDGALQLMLSFATICHGGM
ncbi:hypothetical protein D3C72_1863060 [compost metagenome]